MALRCAAIHQSPITERDDILPGRASLTCGLAGPLSPAAHQTLNAAFGASPAPAERMRAQPDWNKSLILNSFRVTEMRYHFALQQW